jgi:hypothetical protein
MPETQPRLFARQLEPYFEECGYSSAILHDVFLSGNQTASLAAFAQLPFDRQLMNS